MSKAHDRVERVFFLRQSCWSWVLRMLG